MDSLCRNCLQFYGSQGDLCSKCFKEAKLKEDSSQAMSGLLDHIQMTPDEAPGEEKKMDSDHCNRCNKRLGPVNFLCQCKGYFCAKHRLPEQHNCEYDHQAVGKRKLSESNPLVIAEKFTRL